jgi:hypothetical protein
MAQYRSKNDYMQLFPFHGFGDVGISPVDMGGSIDGVPMPGLGIDLSLPYGVGWGDATLLWPGASPIVNAGTPTGPYANTVPPLLAAPAGGAGGISPWLLGAAALGVWYFWLRKG